MSYLGPPFQHDLFVSYSHGAFTGRHEAELKRWSQQFAKDLREDLAFLDFEDVSVFLDESPRSDENVDRTEALSALLRERVVSSALFTLLMTPQYLRSRWCRQELEWWCARHHPDTLGAGSRLYVCRVQPGDAVASPEPLRDVVGFFCYDRDLEPEMARPFGWRGSDDPRYGVVLTEVAGAMAQRLRALKAILDEQRRQEERARRYAAADGLTIFLHGRETAKQAWNCVCERLQNAGFYVVPDGPVPVDDDGGLAPEYQRQLRKSDGLLLLAAEEGPAIDTDILVIGRNYRREAIATGSFLPGAVADMVGVRDERRLRNTRNLGLDWIDLTIDGWPDRVRAWLLEASTQLAPADGVHP
jgi:hypothetical protein